MAQLQGWVHPRKTHHISSLYICHYQGWWHNVDTRTQCCRRLHRCNPLKPPPLAIQPHVLSPLTHTSPVTPLPHIIPLDTHRYPLRHRHNKQPTPIQSMYESKSAFLDQAQANTVTHPITREIQEFLHLIKGPKKNHLVEAPCQFIFPPYTRSRGPYLRHQHHIIHP